MMLKRLIKLLETLKRLHREQLFLEQLNKSTKDQTEAREKLGRAIDILPTELTAPIAEGWNHLIAPLTNAQDLLLKRDKVHQLLKSPLIKLDGEFVAPLPEATAQQILANSQKIKCKQERIRTLLKNHQLQLGELLETPVGKFPSLKLLKNKTIPELCALDLLDHRPFTEKGLTGPDVLVYNYLKTLYGELVAYIDGITRLLLPLDFDDRNKALNKKLAPMVELRDCVTRKKSFTSVLLQSSEKSSLGELMYRLSYADRILALVAKAKSQAQTQS
eukprot:GHVN01056041.1.p1 GENE.GHVN01056041.1~~GHVN01056041.1.p1  ORF type:complete len:275 (+),score=21.82 GHVN01056041.1:56-880(+)